MNLSIPNSRINTTVLSMIVPGQKVPGTNKKKLFLFVYFGWCWDETQGLMPAGCTLPSILLLDFCFY
jgi:hypothetical protein